MRKTSVLTPVASKNLLPKTIRSKKYDTDIHHNQTSR
jgi:hypothetical protein